jgi:hypothetical protein
MNSLILLHGVLMCILLASVQFVVGLSLSCIFLQTPRFATNASIRRRRLALLVLLTKLWNVVSVFVISG